MSFNFPEGAKFQFSTTFAAAKTITGATNADPCVLTATSHGYVDGDEVLFTSGWEDATNTVFVVDQQTADTFQIEGLNSTNTTYFPAGSGTGETQKNSGWTDIPQVLTVATSGGDTRYTDVQLPSVRYGAAVPTVSPDCWRLATVAAWRWRRPRAFVPWPFRASARASTGIPSARRRKSPSPQ